jgi:hypothetical protein
MAKLPGAELFCTRTPHMPGEEVFGSQKRKADVPLGFEGESYRPDKVNFSRPRIATRSSRANHASCSLPDVVEEVSPELQEDQAPNNLGTMGDVESVVGKSITTNQGYFSSGRFLNGEGVKRLLFSQLGSLVKD